MTNERTEDLDTTEDCMSTRTTVPTVPHKMTVCPLRVH